MPSVFAPSSSNIVIWQYNNTPIPVHYEKICIYLHQISVNKAKRHSFIQKGNYLDTKHIHLQILHVHKLSEAFLLCAI